MPSVIGGVWYGGLGGHSIAGGLRRKSPADWRSPGRGLEDEVPQKLKMFYELMFLGWTRVKDLKHLRFLRDVQISCDRHRVCGGSTTKISKKKQY